MKFRTDFVTNSSSSSFIVSVKIVDENDNEYLFADMAEEMFDYGENFTRVCGKKVDRTYGSFGYIQKAIDALEQIAMDKVYITKYPNEDQKRVLDYLKRIHVDASQIVKYTLKGAGDYAGEYYDNCFNGIADIMDVLCNDMDLSVRELSEKRNIPSALAKKLIDAKKKKKCSYFRAYKEKYLYTGKEIKDIDFDMEYSTPGIEYNNTDYGGVLKDIGGFFGKAKVKFETGQSYWYNTKNKVNVGDKVKVSGAKKGLVGEVTEVENTPKKGAYMQEIVEIIK